MQAGGVGVKFMKLFKGGTRAKSLGTSGVCSNVHVTEAVPLPPCRRQERKEI
jgi:hypothetical protein